VTGKPLTQPGTTNRPRLPGVLGELFVLHAAPPRYRSAAIAGLCTTGPILSAQALGQPTLGLIASTGSLAALYGGHGTARQEAAAVGSAAVALTASIAIGSLLAGNPWLSLTGTAVWAAVTTAVGALAAARPPATVMPVLLCAVATGLPAGGTTQRIAAVAAVAACATVLSWLAALRGRPASTGTPSRRTNARLRWQHWRNALARFPGSPVPWMSFRTGLAVALAGSTALACHAGRPYWSMATAAAVLAGGSYAANANRRAVLRGIGTAAGCLVAGALGTSHPQGIAIAVILGVLTVAAELIVARNYALAMVFVTPLSILLVASASLSYPVLRVTADRLIETVLGCLAAAAVGQLVTSRRAVRQRQRSVAALLMAAADLIEGPACPEQVKNLQNALSQLRLVSERTAGERQTVRMSAAALDPLADAAHHVAADVLKDKHGVHPRTSGNTTELRHVAARLSELAGPFSRHLDTAPRYRELEASLAAWHTGVTGQPTAIAGPPVWDAASGDHESCRPPLPDPAYE